MLNLLPLSIRLIYNPYIWYYGVFWFVCVLLLVRWLRVTSELRDAHKHHCGLVPSYPHVDPILGLDAYFRLARAAKQGHMLDELNARFQTVAGGVRTYTTVFFGRRILHTIEVENMKTILASKRKDWEHTPIRKAAFAPFGPGIFSSDGSAWEVSRAKIRPIFSRNHIVDVGALEKHVAVFLSQIPMQGQMMDLLPLFRNLTLDTITESLFGESVGMLNKVQHTKENFGDEFSYVTGVMSLHLRLGWLSKVFPDSRFSDGVSYLKRFVRSYISNALVQRDAEESRANWEDDKKKETKNYVLIDELSRNNFPPDLIQSESLHVLTAAGDSVASTLSALWFVIARRPDVFDKLRQEILREVGIEKIPSYEELRNLKYLRWTINELLRRHPVAPLNTRCAAVDTILPLGGGKDGSEPVFVKAGTMVFTYPCVNHRRKEFFGDDAEDFRPERWEKLQNNPWEYLPFSGGPRVCLGQQYALTEISYITARMLQTFHKVIPGDNSTWAEQISLAIGPKSGCKLILTRV